MSPAHFCASSYVSDIKILIFVTFKKQVMECNFRIYTIR